MSWNHAIVRIVPGQRRRRLAPALASLVAWLAFASAAQAQPWWDANWNERRKLTFNNADQTENLDDFPVLVVLDSTRIDYTKTQDAGEDLRFIDADGITVLSHEIEKWDETGTSYVWVKVPQIVGASTTDHVWMYYDNILALDAQDSAGVWSNGYAGVWHLKESGNGTADEFADATINANHGQGGPASGLGNRKCELVVQSSQVPANLTDFPVLLSEATLPSEMLDADGANPASNGGGDIRFSSDASGSTRLSCEIVNFTTDNNPANGAAEIWVKVPSVSSSSNTSIWVWYDSPGASQPAASAAYGSESVWDTNYKGVWHLNETVVDEQTTGTHSDATSNNNDGTQNGNDDIAAKIGTAQDFDGSDDYVDVGNTIGTLSNDTWSVSAWFKPDELGTNLRREVVWGTVSGNTDERIRIEAYNGYVDIEDDNNLNFRTGNGTVAVGNWHHAVMTYDFPSQVTSMYLNGVWQASDNSFLQASNTLGKLQIGARNVTFYHFNGTIDEVRISNIARSATWITAEYNNQDSPSTFVIEGTPAGTGSVGPAQVTGKIGNAQDFDGVADRVEVASSNSLDILTKGTIEFWMYPKEDAGAGPTYSHVLGRWGGNSGGHWVFFALRPASSYHFEVSDGSTKDFISLNNSLLKLNWYHVVLTWDVDATNDMKAYVNGVLDKEGNSGFTAMGDAVRSLQIASSSDDFYGNLDEVRISNVARSADWNAAQYKSMTDTFIKWVRKIISWREVAP